MNNFTIAENDGRKLFESFINQTSIDIEFTEGQFDHIDAIITDKNGMKAVVEIKKRDTKYLYYPTHILELYKLIKVTEEQVNRGCKIGFYVNFFGDNVMLIYNLNKTANASRLSDVYCGNTTVEYTGHTNKSMLLLEASKAKAYIYSDGKWKLSNLDDVRKASLN